MKFIFHDITAGVSRVAWPAEANLPLLSSSPVEHPSDHPPWTFLLEGWRQAHFVARKKATSKHKFGKTTVNCSQKIVNTLAIMAAKTIKNADSRLRSHASVTAATDQVIRILQQRLQTA